MNRTHISFLLFFVGVLIILPSCYKAEKHEEAVTPIPCPSPTPTETAEEKTPADHAPTPLPALVEAKTVQEFKQLFTQGKPIVLKVSATWCGPCRYMAPLFEKEAVKYCGRAVFVTVDADNSAMQEIIGKYAPRGFPTFSYFDKDGKLIKDHPGSYEENEFALEIKTFVEKYS